MTLRILLFTVFFSSGACFSAYSQKLPGLQQKSMAAPAGAKVDGVPSEWGGKFQAYNRATDIYYSMANDKDNLYLVIQAGDPDVISKIMGQGVTLTIRHSEVKNDQNRISITYPIIESTLYFHLRRRKTESGDISPKAADSLMNHNNKVLNDSCKLIMVKGIPGIDSLISVYNRDGIKAKGQFNNKKAYTYEFSVQLKLLNLDKDQPSFSYEIRLNGTKPRGPVKALSVVPGQESMMNEMLNKVNELNAQNSTPTFFWGKYTLIKQ